MTYRIGSICTGYGGLDAGVAMALGPGAELAWTADTEPGPSRIIEYRMPGVPNLGDITKVSWEDVPPVDVMCGGFPCQPVSGAGKQKGMADERWLWPYIAAAIGWMGAPPRMLVLENVPRLLTIDGGAALAQIVYSLAALGYVGRYGLYRASAAGAPHRRERLFIVAHLAHPDVPRFQRPQRPGVGRWPELVGRGAAWWPAAHAEIVGRPEGRAGADGHGPGPGDQGSAHWIAIDWGKYEPAIRRWEAATGRPVPCPVEPGKNGKPRLAPEFSEWMMGLPAGWVTGVPGLTRSAQLKAIGNGVVPQQAAMAITSLLGGHIGPAQPAGSLLPTPRVQAHDGCGNVDLRDRPNGVNLATAVHKLLPTPEASDSTGSRVASELGGTRPSGAKRSVTLATAVDHLLPTPQANLASNGGPQHPDKRRAGGHSVSLEDVVSKGLLSTPRASDGGWEGGPDGKGQRASSAGWGLRNEVRGLVVGDGEPPPDELTEDSRQGQ